MNYVNTIQLTPSELQLPDSLQVLYIQLILMK